jgi:hypothetical protein
MNETLVGPALAAPAARFGLRAVPGVRIECRRAIDAAVLLGAVASNHALPDRDNGPAPAVLAALATEPLLATCRSVAWARLPGPPAPPSETRTAYEEAFPPS